MLRKIIQPNDAVTRFEHAKQDESIKAKYVGLIQQEKAVVDEIWYYANQQIEIRLIQTTLCKRNTIYKICRRPIVRGKYDWH